MSALAENGPLIGGVVAGVMMAGLCRSKFLLKAAKKQRSATIFRVAVTGGPCAGKSSGMSYIQEKLQGEGYNVYVVPEAATLLICGGGLPLVKDGSEEKFLEFQLQLLKLQMQLEENFTTFAEAEGKPAVVLCDRGLLDARSFCTDAQWEELLRRYAADTGTAPMTRTDIYARYDMCLHYTTAAKGAEQFYTTANNSARTETVEEARAQDDRLLAAWSDHPLHRIVPNKTPEFVKKLEDGMSHIFNLIGLTPPVAFKYRLPNRFQVLPSALPPTTSNTQVTYTALRGSTKDLIYRLCHKLDNLRDVCSHQVIKTSSTHITKTEEQIGMPAYNNMLAMKDPSYETVVVATTSFAFHGKRYELSQVVRPGVVEGETTLIAYDYHDQTSLAELMQQLRSDVVPARITDEEYAADVQRTLLVPTEDMLVQEPTVGSVADSSDTGGQVNSFHTLQQSLSPSGRPHRQSV